jgi:protein-S-isoprenylcysteine O-methyltransferase Ste14
MVANFPGTVAHWVFASAALAAALFFCVGLTSYFERRPDRPLWVRGIHDAGMLLSLLHVTGAFLLTPRSDAFAVAGAMMYTGAVLIFLSAIEATNRTRLQRAFVDHPLPDRLITDGPYRLVRHPFYLGYIVGALAPAIAIDHIAIFLVSVAMIAITVAAAFREERVWLASPRADAYRDYRQRTGMLLPLKIGAIRRP